MMSSAGREGITGAAFETHFLTGGLGSGVLEDKGAVDDPREQESVKCPKN